MIQKSLARLEEAEKHAKSLGLTNTTKRIDELKNALTRYHECGKYQVHGFLVSDSIADARQSLSEDIANTRKFVMDLTNATIDFHKSPTPVITVAWNLFDAEGGFIIGQRIRRDENVYVPIVGIDQDTRQPYGTFFEQKLFKRSKAVNSLSKISTILSCLSGISGIVTLGSVPLGISIVFGAIFLGGWFTFTSLDAASVYHRLKIYKLEDKYSLEKFSKMVSTAKNRITSILDDLQTRIPSRPSASS
jgi:hypothetical protein